VLAGLEADPNQCRRLPENELWRIIKDQKRPERNRLILRKIHQGEPGDVELQRAASIAMEEAAANHSRAIEGVDKRSQLKVQKVLGERAGTKVCNIHYLLHHFNQLDPLYLPESVNVMCTTQQRI
jgi:hypothetical protein